LVRTVQQVLNISKETSLDKVINMKKTTKNIEDKKDEYVPLSKLIGTKKNIRVYSVDWAHKDEREEWYEVIQQNWLKDKPELKKGDIVLLENVPFYKAKELFNKGIIILTCHTMATHDHRAKLGLPMLKHYKHDGHRPDAFVIADLYANKPELFYGWKPNPIKMLYSNFTQIRKARIATGNRAWSEEAKEITNSTIEFLEKAEHEAAKATDKFGKNNIIYDYIKSIPQIGINLAGGLMVVDPTKYPTASKFRKGCGLAVEKGEPQKLVKGKSAGYRTEVKSRYVFVWAEQVMKSSGSNPKQPNRKTCPYFIDYQRAKERMHKEQPITLPIEPKDKIIGDLFGEDLGEITVGNKKYKLKKGKVIYKHLYPGVKEIVENNGGMIKIILSKGHIHRRAVRVMSQRLNEDIWVIWRQLLGFPTVEPFIVTKNGIHTHYENPRVIPDILKPFKPIREGGWIFKHGLRDWSLADPYIVDNYK